MATSEVPAQAAAPTQPSVGSGAMAERTDLPHLVESLRGFSTCEISDALVKLNHPTGGHLPGIDAWSPSTSHAAAVAVAPSGGSSDVPRICGPAFTVRMVSTEDKEAPRPPRHFVDAVEEAPRGCVMVITAPPNTRSAIWGGLMTARAQALGVAGVVLDGRCRDLSEHRDANFAVFARGHSTLGQSPFTRPSQLNVPLRIRDAATTTTTTGTGAAEAEEGWEQHDPAFGATPVEPDDLVVADVDGVVVVPRSMGARVVELAAKARDVDARCMEDLRRGRSIAETFKEHRGK